MLAELLLPTPNAANLEQPQPLVYVSYLFQPNMAGELTLDHPSPLVSVCRQDFRGSEVQINWITNGT